MKDRPQNTPLDEWAPAWLKIETANLLKYPAYILMHDHEKRAAGYPISEHEMRVFIRAWHLTHADQPKLFGESVS